MLVFLAIAALVAGILLLVVGGDILVRGAAALAFNLGVSPLVVGLTVVAFGTSAPELAVNIIAAIQGQAGVSFGNIVGSNIANIGLIIGIAALIKPLNIQKSMITREIPMMLLATAVVVVMGNEQFFSSISDEPINAMPNQIGRGDGVILLVMFVAFLLYTIREAMTQRGADQYLNELEELHEEDNPTSVGFSILLLIGGLIAVVAGGALTVEGAVRIARYCQVSEEIIGLTIVAIGTSLPELAASIMAVRRGQTDIAVGNAVGSNIFNLLLILGSTAMISPIPIPPGGVIDMLVMAGLALVLLPLSVTDQQRIIRTEGGLLLAIYFSYLLGRVAFALSEPTTMAAAAGL